MKKTRILISSVLKPVNDTRMYEKIGSSLAKLPNAEVHIAGFQVVLPNTSLPITFHPFSFFNRLSWKRFKVQFEYWKLLRRLKPDLLIISTHEFLLLSLIFKIFYRVNIWYDVRENYYLNLTTQSFYGGFIKYVLAFIIRFTEYVTSPFISQYLLAEKSYAQELPFIQNKYVILENKFAPLHTAEPLNKIFPVKIIPGPIKLLFSGTISEMHGIFEAVELSRQLHLEQANITLVIIGYCTVPETLTKLKEIIKTTPYITLIGGDTLVPHSQIVQQIKECQVGLLPYQPHPSTFRCVPTKLFEYLANGLPVLVQQNPYWAERVNQYQAGINLNFKKFNPKELLNKLYLQEFYPAGHPQEALWESQEPILFKLLTLNFKHL